MPSSPSYRALFWQGVGIAHSSGRRVWLLVALLFLAYFISSLMDRILPPDPVVWLLSGEAAFQLFVFVFEAYCSILFCAMAIYSVRGVSDTSWRRPWKTVFKVVMINVALLISAGLGYFLISVQAVYLYQKPYDTMLGVVGSLVSMLFALCLLFLCFLPVLRCWPVVSALSVGDTCSFSRAWAMTKGETVKLFILIGGLVVLGGGMDCALAFLMPDSHGGEFGYDAVLAVLAAVAGLYMSAFSGTLYEKLRCRYNKRIISSAEDDMAG